MEHKKVRVTIDISWTAILKVIIVALVFFAAVALRDILLMLFVVFIFVAGVNPTIRQLQKHMSRTLAVALFFTLMVLAFALLAYAFIPLLITQIDNLIGTLPSLADKTRVYIDGNSHYASYLNKVTDSATTGLKSLTGNIFQTTVTFFGGLATIVTGIILAFYVLLEEKNARDFFHQVLPSNKFEAVYTTVRKISHKMGDWIRGQLLLMLIIGLCNFLAFWVLGIPSPLVIGLWAGIAEVVPYVGPFIGVIPALFIALASGNYLQAILVFIINFIVIQQIEANIVVPKVMGRAVGLSPVLVILSLTVGLRLFGLVGAIISLPTAAILSVIFEEWSNLRQIWERSEEHEVGEAA